MAVTVATFDVNRVCRVCLNGSGNLYFIYDEVSGTNTMAHILNACLRYPCERNDKMPSHMCGRCMDAARQAYSFKQQAEESYRSLVDLLGLSQLLLTKYHDHLVSDKFLKQTTDESTSVALQCKLCDRQFDALGELAAHLTQDHSLKGSHCNTCNRRNCNRPDHVAQSIRDKSSIKVSTMRRATEKSSPNNGTVVPMHSDDELESAAVMLNEQYNDTTNPISSNDEGDNVTKQSLLINLKPEPCINAGITQLPETVDVDNKVTDVASRLKREKKRRRKVKRMISRTDSDQGNDGDGDSDNGESDGDGEMEDYPVNFVRTETALVKTEPDDYIKEEQHFINSEDDDDDDDDGGGIESPEFLPNATEDEFFDDTENEFDGDGDGDVNDTDDDDDDDGDDDDEVDNKTKSKGVEKKRLAIGKEKRRRRNKSDKSTNPENRCEICQRTFSRHCHLLRHKLSHMQNKPHSCPHCPKAFARSDHLKAHVQSLHTSKKFKCSLCDSAFTRFEALERHKVNKHNGDGLDPNSKRKLHSCEYCEKRFSTKTYLRKHILLHTDFLFACKNCDETFKDRKQLREHEKTHTGQRNFLCCICGDSFARNDYLRVHMRRHNGEKPYKCRFCVKAFPRATDLKVHERYHTGTKPNLCNTCGKSFHRAYNLTIHMRTHTGERPYKCDQCPKSFTQSNDLKAHIRRHTGERYKCPHCDTYFLQLYHMRNHCLNVHNKLIETKTGRLQRTGLLEDGQQPHLTTVVLPPPLRYPNLQELQQRTEQQQQQSQNVTKPPQLPPASSSTATVTTTVTAATTTASLVHPPPTTTTSTRTNNTETVTRKILTSPSASSTANDPNSGSFSTNSQTGTGTTTTTTTTTTPFSGFNYTLPDMGKLKYE